MDYRALTRQFQSNPGSARPTLKRVEHPSFSLIGDPEPQSPVILSVPHAGRDYPPALLAALAVPEGALVALEDRHVDAVALAARRCETLLVQHRPRAWIDLNRGERERDARVDEGAVAGVVHASTKVRGGLGLVPHRASGALPIWSRRFTAAEIEARIVADHRPYHRVLDALLAAARARYGVAVLLDLHSMPSLPAEGAQAVIGDQFGRSAGAAYRNAALAAVAGAGLKGACNIPYAGGYIVGAHSRPARGVHALQLELDRALYLDGARDRPSAGLPATAAVVRAVIEALTACALGEAAVPPLAAE